MFQDGSCKKKKISRRENKLVLLAIVLMVIFRTTRIGELNVYIPLIINFDTTVTAHTSEKCMHIDYKMGGGGYQCSNQQRLNPLKIYQDAVMEAGIIVICNQRQINTIYVRTHQINLSCTW